MVSLAHSMEAVCFALKLGYPKTVELLDVGDVSQATSRGGAWAAMGAATAGSWLGGTSPPGEWNEWDVSCLGTKLSLKVNGTLAWEIDSFQPARRPLGIEAEGHAIEFRNLRIKTLSGSTPP